MTIDDLHATAAVRGWLGDLDYAERTLRKVVRARPDDAEARKHLAIVLLAQGNFREGAPLYEARLDAPRDQPDPPLPFRRWRGEPLDGRTVLVWPEQGLGDQIMFARFLPTLQQRGCDVSVICHPSLERLFRESLDVRILKTTGTVEFPDPDFWLFSNSLLSLVRSEDDIPGKPYLRSAAAEPSLRVGVVTRGNPTHGNDPERSLPTHLAEELLGLPGLRSLAPEDTGAADFSDTAALIAGLDLVISVDTSVAHLAGAMGKPVWILLPAVGTDWRWQAKRSDSPWYPTATLFRQPERGDWTSVLAEIKRRLSQSPRR